MKKTIIAAAVLVAMTACNKNVIEMTPSEGYGYIDLGVTADTEMVVVKSGETEATTPIYNDYMVTLKQGESVIWGPKKYSEVTDWKVPAGTGYLIYIENMDEAAAAPANEKGSVRVAGTSAAFEVKAGINTPVSVNCVAINSRVTVANSFNTDVFTSSTITITDGTRALPMEWGHTEANSAYYSAGKAIGWNLTVTLADGSQKTYSKTETTTTQAKKWTQINFTNSNTNGNITVEIVVDGTITETITVSETIDPLEGTPAN